MQVFVSRADLALPTVPVLDTFPELPVVPREYFGLQAAVLSLPQAAIKHDPETNLTSLVGNWRVEHVEQVVNGEAERRILESYSTFMQRNALWAMQHNIIRYGSNQTTWGSTEQALFSTVKQAWDYVDDVRGTADTMLTNMPIDPTNDANWPARLPPVYVPHHT